MKILLFGRDGQVGQALGPGLSALGDLVACSRAEVDLASTDELRRIVARHKPDVIVNAAAYTAVDRAEAEPDLARRINRDAPAVLAAMAEQYRAWLIHYSTDYVFDGRKDGPYVETDTPAPLSMYGRTKLEGDEAIVKAGGRHLIFRVSWVYAVGHNNFPASMLKLAKDRQSLNVVSDQIGAPTSAELIAGTTVLAVGALKQNPDSATRLPGLYHLSAAGSVSRADLAKFIVAEAREQGTTLALRPDHINPILTADFPLPAARPLNSRFDTKKLQRTFGITLPDWKTDIRDWTSKSLSRTSA